MEAGASISSALTYQNGIAQKPLRQAELVQFDLRA